MPYEQHVRKKQQKRNNIEKTHVIYNNLCLKIIQGHKKDLLKKTIC